VDQSLLPFWNRLEGAEINSKTMNSLLYSEAVFLVMCDPPMNELYGPKQVYAYISMGLGHSLLIRRRVAHK
jgi:hypothetical protein